MAFSDFKMDSREYKLLLKPSIFEGQRNLDGANALWQRHFKSVVESVLGADAFAPGAAFKKPKVREIRFWDTPEGHLAESNFSLRQRIDKGESKLTLKLRTPDLFIASATQLPTSDGKSTFEEDIGPLAVKSRKAPSSTGDPVALPAAFSLRSRFSRSATIKHAFSLEAPSFADVASLYPTLEKCLTDAGVSPPSDRSRPMISGPKVAETAFSDLKARPGPDIEIEFTLSVWEFGESPDTVEISFKYDTVDGRVALAVAQQVMDLFIAMQRALDGLIDMDETSKTARALPVPKGSP